MAVLCVLAGCSGDKIAGGETVEAWDSPSAESAAGSGAKDFAVETKGYGEGLAKYVDGKGLVNYAGWQSGRAGLDSYIENIARQDYASLRARPDAEQLAFWFNAYNAITIKYILDHHPIEKGGVVSGALYPANSIRQIKGVWDSLKTPVAGRELTLDEIEHEVLRAQFSEPRLHVALVCAARSCPPLRNEPYTADMFDEQLDDQARKFLKSQHGLQIDRERGRIRVSAIFDWYGGDFVKSFGSAESLSGHNETETAVLHFIAQHVSEEDAAYIEQAEYSLRYLDYDWTLNEQ
jgi:hypothetical protein